jgi:hypothetical protein
MRAGVGATMLEVTRRVPIEPADDDDAAANEIERRYQGMLIGVRLLPRSPRPAARRAAREWRQMMLAALREKRARECCTRRVMKLVSLAPC